jgi:hypothetical protein
MSKHEGLKNDEARMTNGRTIIIRAVGIPSPFAPPTVRHSVIRHSLDIRH